MTGVGGAAPGREFRALARGATVSFALVGESERRAVTIVDGEPRPPSDEPDFTLIAPDELWNDLTADAPPPGRHSIVHLVRTGLVRVDGDADAFWRHVHLVRSLLSAARDDGAVAPPEPRPLRASGSYHRVATSLGRADLHVERCGDGPPLLAFATAGSDISQWHGVMTRTDLTDRYELITVDLPWHGMSSPIAGAAPGDWHLTPETYTELIVAVADALHLSRPTLIGASMAGAAVVHAVATHPDRFAGAVSCQAGRSVRNRTDPRLRATDVNPSLFIPEWTVGLMNPASPVEMRRRVWWGYSSAGQGLYAADIDSYQQWDLGAVEQLLTTDSPHIAVLSGSYDTTVPPAASRELAAAIPNASFVEMPELGHFPHAENPEIFVRYLEDALLCVRACDPSAAESARH
ncbi:alpha/beta fold hydrolase [Microbacterium gorillae]|uniref:alpha/beta fold hydrolase n=1 Tax=Microbacterium gorillae TaxID=1231063 RepID=UPI00058D7EBA|nr:alpha/beta hydrolase [Microbacterium gorillae]